MGNNQKKERRGGKREGAGRKPETISAAQVRAMLKTAEKYAKKEGGTVDDVLLSILYDEKTADNHRLAAIKIFKEHTMARVQEGGEADRVQAGPAFYLPGQRPKLE